MARKIDPTKPLSEEDRKYLLQRYSAAYVASFPGADEDEQTMPETPLSHAEKARAESDDPSAISDPVRGLRASGDTEEDLLGTAGDFDPSTHTVSEVEAYLSSASDEEKQRVMDAERSGKARSSILNG